MIRLSLPESYPVCGSGFSVSPPHFEAGFSPHFSHGKRREGPSAAADNGSYSRSACPQADTSSGRHFDLNAPLPTTLTFAQQSSDRQRKSHRCEKCGLEPGYCAGILVSAFKEKNWRRYQFSSDDPSAAWITFGWWNRVLGIVRSRNATSPQFWIARTQNVWQEKVRSQSCQNRFG